MVTTSLTEIDGPYASGFWVADTANTSPRPAVHFVYASTLVFMTGLAKNHPQYRFKRSD